MPYHLCPGQRFRISLHFVFPCSIHLHIWDVQERCFYKPICCKLIEIVACLIASRGGTMAISKEGVVSYQKQCRGKIGLATDAAGARPRPLGGPLKESTEKTTGVGCETQAWRQRALGQENCELVKGSDGNEARVQVYLRAQKRMRAQTTARLVEYPPRASLGNCQRARHQVGVKCRETASRQG